MPISAKRVYRLSLTISLALAIAYGSGVTLSFIAPLFAFMLSAKPQPPMGVKGLFGLCLVLVVLLSSGLLLIPALIAYPMTALMLAVLGLFLANYLTLNMGKGPAGSLLTVGIGLISALGLLNYQLAVGVIAALLINIAIAVVSSWLVYPFFPESGEPSPEPPSPEPMPSSWLALRATLIVFPSYLLILSNPIAYSAIMMKSVQLGQQSSETEVGAAGRELVGSTIMAGVLAIAMWFCLKLYPDLWMFFLWTVAFTLFISARFYGVVRSRFSPAFWQNVMITLFILVGPAVEDSANGKDPYAASFVRISLFICVAVYAWLAMVFLDWLRQRRQLKSEVAVMQLLQT